MKKRSGRAARRQLEFDVIMDQLTRRRAEFIKRLERWVRQDGDCQIWVGADDGCGYGVLSFRFKGRHIKINVPRIVLILKSGAPIPVGMEAGHSCTNSRCIKHLVPQHYRENADWTKQANGTQARTEESVPF